MVATCLIGYSGNAGWAHDLLLIGDWTAIRYVLCRVWLFSAWHAAPRLRGAARNKICHAEDRLYAQENLLRAYALLLVAFALPLPTAPLARHAPRIASITSDVPSLFRMDVNKVGPVSRMRAASRRMTSSDAPTWGARSVCNDQPFGRAIKGNSPGLPY